MKKPTIEKIYEALNENHICAEVHEYDSNTICIDIRWGDWKHDHIRVDRIMEETFSVICSWHETTEEDGSDCFSADHYYRFD